MKKLEITLNAQVGDTLPSDVLPDDYEWERVTTSSGVLLGFISQVSCEGSNDGKFSILQFGCEEPFLSLGKNREDAVSYLIKMILLSNEQTGRDE